MIWIARTAIVAAGALVAYVVVVAIPLDMWRNHKTYQRLGKRWWQ